MILQLFCSACCNDSRIPHPRDNVHLKSQHWRQDGISVLTYCTVTYCIRKDGEKENTSRPRVNMPLPGHMRSAAGSPGTSELCIGYMCVSSALLYIKLPACNSWRLASKQGGNNRRGETPLTGHRWLMQLCTHCYTQQTASWHKKEKPFSYFYSPCSYCICKYITAFSYIDFTNRHHNSMYEMVQTLDKVISRIQFSLAIANLKCY